MDCKEFHGMNLASDYICDGLRVSTGVHRSGHIGGQYDQYETWIFSDVDWQRSTQIIHGTASAIWYGDEPFRLCQGLSDKALRVHAHIVGNMRKRAELGVGDG